MTPSTSPGFYGNGSMSSRFALLVATVGRFIELSYVSPSVSVPLTRVTNPGQFRFGAPPTGRTVEQSYASPGV